MEKFHRLPDVQISYCYESITPEDAEHGEAGEIGFWSPGGWTTPIRNREGTAKYSDDARPDPDVCTAREALDAIRRHVGPVDHAEISASTLYVYPVDGSVDYRTGEETRISAHVRGDARLLRAMLRALTRGGVTT
jgi:hypothetical protein